MKKLKRYLSPRELYEVTGIPRSTWYDVIARGEIPHVRVRSSIRVAEDDALRYLERREPRTVAR